MVIHEYVPAFLLLPLTHCELSLVCAHTIMHRTTILLLLTLGILLQGIHCRNILLQLQKRTWADNELNDYWKEYDRKLSPGQLENLETLIRRAQRRII